MGIPYQSIRDIIEPRLAAKLERASRREAHDNGRARFARYGRRPWNNDTDYKPLK